MLVFGALLGATSATASAQQDGAGLRVHLEVAACAEVESRSVARFLSIELDNAAVHVGDAEDEPVRLRVSCEDSALVLDVEDRVTRKALRRSVDRAAGDPSLRARLMAVAVAELVLASFAETDLGLDRARPDVAAREPVATLAARRIVAARRPTIRERRRAIGALEAYVEARAYSEGAAVIGGGVSGRVRWTGPWGSEVRLGVASALDERVDAATLSASSLDGSASIDFAMDGASTTTRIFVGARGALVQFAAEVPPGDARRVVARTAYSVGPAAGASFEWRIAHAVAVAARGEIGYGAVAATADVEGRRGLSLGGVWGAGSVGLAWLQ